MLELRQGQQDSGSHEQPGQSETTAIASRGRIHCRACATELTKAEWACIPQGAHRHVRTNPAGLTFSLRCFAPVPGVLPQGPATLEHSWFPGMAWRIGLCGGCGAHVGWTFSGAGAPFAALIEDRIRESPAP